MKRINFLLGVLAVSSTALFSSCFSSDGSDEAPEAPQVGITDEVISYIIKTKVNGQEINDDFTVTTDAGGKTLKKGDKVKITVEANDKGVYTVDKQVKTITCGAEANIVVEFTFNLKPATVDLSEGISEVVETIEGVESGTAFEDIDPEILANADVPPIVIYQGENNSEGTSTVVTEETQAAQNIVLDVEDNNDVAPVTVGKVTLEAPVVAVQDAVKASEDNTAAFSIVVEKAVDENVEQIPVEQAEELAQTTSDANPQEVSTISLVCEPSGVQFTKPVTVKVNVTDVDGLDVVAVNTEGGKQETINVKAEGNVLTAEIPHFSVWDFVLRADIQDYNVTDGNSSTYTKTVTKGENKFTYNSNYSWEVEKETKSNSLVNAFLKTLFGSSKKTTVKASAIFDSTGDGVVTYKVTEKIATFKVVSGTGAIKRTYRVKAQIGSVVEIIGVEYIQPGHSGGTAN